MTVSSETSSISYAGNGVTLAFAIPFYFLADGDLTVIVTDDNGATTTQTLTTHYTVSGAGNPAGGTVTMLSAPGATDTLTIIRDPAATQSTDYVANDPFPAETHETALDRLTMLVQRLKQRITLSLRFADGDPQAGVDPLLPAPAVRAGKWLKFDATGALELATVQMPAVIGADLYPINGLDYGMVSDPTLVTDSTLGLQAAVDAAVADRNGVVFVPAGTYVISGQITVPTGVMILCAGSQGSTTGYGTNFIHKSNGHFLVWDGSGTIYAGTGGGLFNCLIQKYAGYAGGDCLRVIATDDDHRPGEMLLFNVLGAYTGSATWTRGLHVDGSACTTPGTKGVRSVISVKCRFAGCSHVASISAASSASPIEFTTSAAHDMTTGDVVKFKSLPGDFGTALNNNSYQITKTAANKFTVAVNGGGFAAYTSGGTATAYDYVKYNQAVHCSSFHLQIDQGSGSDCMGLTVCGDTDNFNLSSANINGSAYISGASAMAVAMHGHISNVHVLNASAEGAFVGAATTTSNASPYFVLASSRGGNLLRNDVDGQTLTADLFKMSGVAPEFTWEETDAAANAQQWGAVANANIWSLRTWNDAHNASDIALQVNRDPAGYAVTSLTFGNGTNNPTYSFAGTSGISVTGGMVVNGLASSASLKLSNAAPLLNIYESDQAADEKAWAVSAVSKTLYWRAYADDLGSPKDILAVGRGTGSAIASISIGNATDNPPATFLGTGLVSLDHMKLRGAAVSVSAGEVSLGNDTQTTVGAAGGASNLPGAPTGYLKIYIGSTQYVIPYWPQA